MGALTSTIEFHDCTKLNQSSSKSELLRHLNKQNWLSGVGKDVVGSDMV